MTSLFDISHYEELQNYLSELEAFTSEESLKGLIQDIQKPALINHIRGMVISAVGINGFNPILEILDKLLSSTELPIPNFPDDVRISNLAFFAPTYFWNNFFSFNEVFAFFGYHASTSLLARSGNLKKLLEKLEKNKQVKLSPTFTIQAAFRASADEEYNEIEICNLLLEHLSNVPGALLVRTALRRRINNFKVQAPIEFEAPPRTALMICGQFRDVERMLPQFAQKYELSQMDVYVSTWETPGFTPIDRARLARRLNADIVEEIRNDFTDKELDIIAEFERNRLVVGSKQGGLEESIKDALVGAKSVHIHTADDEEVVYKNMSNHQKMYFHNAYWIHKLGKGFFLSNYDVMIKTRPDLIMSIEKPISPKYFQNLKNNLASDHPSWLYETWGFGAGDQFFYGLTSTMLPILNIQYPTSLSTRLLSEVFLLTRIYQGHLNIGIELWLNGGRPIPAPIVKKGLASDHKLSRDQFFLLASNAGLKKNPTNI